MKIEQTPYYPWFKLQWHYLINMYKFAFIT